VFLVGLDGERVGNGEKVLDKVSADQRCGRALNAHRCHESQAVSITQRLQERLRLVSGDVACARVGGDVAQLREFMLAIAPGWSVFSRMVTSYPRASRMCASFFIEICCRLLSTRER